MNEQTRFSELSEKLADFGGDGVLEVLSDLEGHRLRGVVQDPTQVTSARMIKNEFGILKFNELPALEIQARFNALHGSNTRPRAILKNGFEAKYIGQPVYFDRLDRVKFDNDFENEILIKELESAVDIPAGAMHWNKKKAKDKIFIKCSGSACSGKYDWVSFSEITLSGIGKVKASDLITKFMENKAYNQTKFPEFKY